jgi:hypothetical protein
MSLRVIPHCCIFIPNQSAVSCNQRGAKNIQGNSQKVRVVCSGLHHCGISFADKHIKLYMYYIFNNDKLQ